MPPQLDTIRRATTTMWPRFERDRSLGPASLARDGVAAAATRTVQQFDDFLAAHGAPAAARIPDGFDVIIAAQVIGASGNAGAITLGAKRDAHLRPSGRSPELIGHELVHSVHMRAGTGITDATYEGWADIVGNAFARSIGAPEASDWKLGHGDFTPRFANHAVRDMSRPRVFDAAGVERHLQAFRSPSFDEHDTPGPLTKAATLVADATSPEVMGTIFTRALLHDLAPRVAAAAANVPPRDPAADGPDPNAVLGELRATAQATMDAATHLHGPASPELIAVRDAFAAVGLGEPASRRAVGE